MIFHQSLKRCFLVGFVLSVFSQSILAGHISQATSGIYADFSNDTTVIRIIDAWLRMYQKGDSSFMQEGDKEALAWWDKQTKLDPSKVARVGLEILKRETDVHCKAFMVDSISSLKPFDKAPLIEAIHNQLQQLPRNENGGIRADGYPLLESSAMALASYGAESDKDLLLSLSRDCPNLLKTMVSNEVKKLDERLAKEKANPRPPKSRGGQDGPASATGRPGNTGTQSAIAEFLYSNHWTWIIGGGLILIGGSLLARRFISHPNRK